MYILLSGQPPFDGEDEKEVILNVRIGHYSLDTRAWKLISKDAKDLIQKLLKYDPNQRISAKDALQHQWFSNCK